MDRTSSTSHEGQAAGWRGLVQRALAAWLAHYQRVADAQQRNPHGF